MKQTLLMVLVFCTVIGGLYYWYNFLREFELTFETNGGNEIVSLRLKHDDEIPELEIPTKEGFVFAGWYTDSLRTKPFTMNTMPAKPITLYADWGTEGLLFVKVGSGYTASIGTANASEIVIPKRYQGEIVNAIAYQGFQFNQVLKSIHIPNTVSIIGTRAFANSSLEQVIFEPDSGLHIIDEEAFARSKIQAIVIPQNVTEIRFQAFLMCSDLASVTFEEGSRLRIIGVQAFLHTPLLTSIILPDTVETVDHVAFANSGLTEFVVSSTSELRIIGDMAFSYTSLTQFHFPSKLNYIGAGAFAETSLTAIYIPISVEIIRHNAFVLNTPHQVFTLIYVEAESKPTGWDNAWNSYSYPVVWNAGTDE